MNKTVLCLCCALLLSLLGCSRQQGDWEKTRAANSTDAYEQFLKKYPHGEFSKQAELRVKELYQERDWQKARDTDTQEAYQAFLKQHPEGALAEEARIRIENFSLGQAPTTGAAAAGPTAGPADAAPATSRAGEPSPKPAPASKPSVSKPAARSMPRAVPKSRDGAKPSAPPSSAGGGKSGQPGPYAVQLGAFKSSQDLADKRWQRLQGHEAKVLRGLSPTISPKQTASGTLYRLQVTGLTAARAHAICKALKAKSQACLIVPPRHGG